MDNHDKETAERLKKLGIQTKEIPIVDFKVAEENGKFYITGYANTKDVPDSYGDIPHSLDGKPVYILDRMKTNPVCFVDHWSSASNIAGNFVTLDEDDKGLLFKLLLRPLEEIYNNQTKDAVSAYMSKFGHALSIGGSWYFEDPDNPNHLTKALIYEISLVGVGADRNALVDAPLPKHIKSIEDMSELDAKTIEKMLRDGVKVSRSTATKIVSLISPMLQSESDSTKDQSESDNDYDWGSIVEGLKTLKIEIEEE